MHLRITHLTPAGTSLEEAISGFEKATASVRDLPGFAAVVLMADREAGGLVVGSYWETEEAMHASEAAARAAAAELGVDFRDPTGYEVLHLERTQPLRAGTYARLVTAELPADRIADARRDLEERLLPRARALEGFRSVVLAADPRGGRLFCGSIWDSVAARAASDAEFSPGRARLAETIGATSVTVENCEVVFASVKVAAGAGT